MVWVSVLRSNNVPIVPGHPRNKKDQEIGCGLAGVGRQ